MFFILLTMVGACTGSFAAVVIERRRTGESFVTGRSHCQCGATIPMRWNIPIVSYAVARGRARCCGAAIPRWYVAIETAMALSGAACGLLIHPPAVAVIAGVFTWVTVGLAFSALIKDRATA